MISLREHLEAIRDRCRPIPASTPAERQAYEHAVAALAELNAAPRHIPRDTNQRLVPTSAVRLVPDPETRL